MAISKILMKQSDLYNPEGSIYIADYVNGVFKVMQCTQSEWQKKERCSKGRRESLVLMAASSKPGEVKASSCLNGIRGPGKKKGGLSPALALSLQ